MNWRVKTQWFSELAKYHYFETEQKAKDFIATVAEPQRLWWILEKRKLKTQKRRLIMNEETRDFLLECKKAGYEFVAICCVDKRVPISVKLEKIGERKYSNMPSGGEYWGESAAREYGLPPRYPPTVICAAPNRRDTGRPAIWDICKNSPLTAALDFGGLGCGESHQIRPNHNLERGCYDLKEVA